MNPALPFGENQFNTALPHTRFSNTRLLACLCLVVFALFTGKPAFAVVGNNVIATVAGGYSGDGGQAAVASFNTLGDVAVDSAGNFYVVDTYGHRIRKVSVATGVITTVAGSGLSGFSGDGGLAVSASLNFPRAVEVDSSGNLYIADSGNHRVRMVNSAGVITTVAGNGASVYGGDGGPATAASFGSLDDLGLYGGSLYIVDGTSLRIRRVDSSGNINTVAGNGQSGHGGDGGAATSANFMAPKGIELDGNGNVFIADYGDQRIRKVDASGLISTVAGNGTAGFSGDGGSATAASLRNPTDVKVSADNSLYIADSNNNRVRKVTGGTIATVAGNGSVGYSGDGGQATSASFAYPGKIALDAASGYLYIADTSNLVIRRLDGSGIVTTVAGGSVPLGDGMKANAISLNNPVSVAFDNLGNLYIADTIHDRIRKVDLNGVITTLAGNGTEGFGGDLGLATAASLNSPNAIVADGSQNIYIADSGNHRIRRVDAKTGTIATVAGNGVEGSSSEGVSAVTSSLAYPSGIALDGNGNFYIADTLNHRVHKVDATGIITTMAGNGTAGFSGDGGAAKAASLFSPTGIILDVTGNLFVVDSANNRVRKVDGNGIITTVAGNGSTGFAGDGGLATAASLAPAAVTVDNLGNLYISDNANQRIRKVSTSGQISTVAGNGLAGFNGDGGSALSASMAYPNGLTLDQAGNLYFADTANQRIRKVGSYTIAPSVSLTATSTTVNYQGSSTLNWSSTNATVCTASGGWSGAQSVSGSLALNGLTATQTYTLACTGNGQTASQSVTVTVNPPPAVTVSLAATLSTVNYQGSATLNWSSANATACTASGGWSGTKPVSGSLALNGLTATQTYTLACTGNGQTASQSVTVTVNPAVNAAAECLFNWAEKNYPSLFGPAGALTQNSAPYTYRYYTNTRSYLGVSSDNNHVYYLGSDGSLQDEGDLSGWLTTSGCQTVKPDPKECLFNWAETNYPGLFSPSGGSTLASPPYSYRYYKSTNAYLGVSSDNNHVYYLGPDGVLRDEGALSGWLITANCQ